MRKLKTFSNHFRDEKLAEEQRQKEIAEEQKKKQLELENQDSGWESLTGKQDVVEDYIKWITR